MTNKCYIHNERGCSLHEHGQVKALHSFSLSFFPLSNLLTIPISHQRIRKKCSSVYVKGMQLDLKQSSCTTVKSVYRSHSLLSLTRHWSISIANVSIFYAIFIQFLQMRFYLIQMRISCMGGKVLESQQNVRRNLLLAKSSFYR